MKEYLGEDQVKVSVSPYRVAYLVPEGDAAAFEAAVGHASGRWAGQTEPIISLLPDGSVADGDVQVLETLGVLALVAVDCEAELIRPLRLLDLPIIGPKALHASRVSRSIPWHAVCHDRSNIVAARPHGPLWEKVAAGIDPVGDGWGSATPDNAGRAALEGRTILEAGLGGFAESEAHPISAGPVTLWVTEPDSLADCQMFWNYRAMRCLRWPASPMFILPVESRDDWLGLPEVIRQIVLRRAFDGDPDVVINSLSIDPEVLVAFGEQLGLRRRDSKELVLPSARSFEGSATKDVHTFSIDVDPRDWLLHDRLYGYDEWFRIQAFRTGTSVPVMPASVEPVIKAHPGLPLRLNLSGGFIRDLPQTPLTAKAVFESAVWSRGVLESIVGVSSNALLSVNVPSADDLLPLVLADLPVTSMPSDKGRLTESLLKRHDAALLSGSRTLAVIQALTTRRSKELLKSLKQFASPLPSDVEEAVGALGGRVERNYRSASRLGAERIQQPEASLILEQLADSGWTERGFSTHCGACGMAAFVALASISETAICPHCRTPSPYVQGTGGVEVYYRLDAFADRCSDQGVIAHAAIGRALLALHEYSAATFGVDVVWPDGGSAEIDILGFIGATRIAGEIKTSPSEFTDEQMRRDVALTARLGIGTHVLAFTKAVEDEAVIERALQACSASDLKLIAVRPGADGIISAHRF